MLSRCASKAKRVQDESEEPVLLSGRNIWIGTAGWNIPREQRDNFTSQGSHLERYSRVFNCCEINSSFYRPHREQTWERWANSVPVGFRFSVKAPKAITHVSRLRRCAMELSEFLSQTSHLREKLGAVLFQLPPSLQFDDALARSFFSLVREMYAGQVICEARHSSWFEEEPDSLLKDFKIARAAADPPIVPAGAHPGGLNTLAYFRFHGSPRIYYSDYGDAFLDKVAAELKTLTDNSTAWCIFDNTAAGCAARNALALSAKVQEFSICPPATRSGPGRRTLGAKALRNLTA